MKSAPLAVLVSLLAAACESTPPEPAPVPAANSAAPAPPRPPPFPERPSLSRVLRRAETVPLLEAAQAAVESEEGRRTQEGYWPNPFVLMKAESIDLDNIAGGPNRWTVVLFQEFETAGKRSKRKQIGSRLVQEASERARWERFRIARAASSAHQTALVTRLQVSVAEQLLERTRELRALQLQLVEAGRADESTLPDLEARTGKVAATLAELRARRRSVLRNLEGILSLPPRSLADVEGDTVAAPLPSVPADADPAEFFADNPEIASLRAAEETAAARLAHARALAWPDVTVGVAWEQGHVSTATSDQTLGLWLQVPLPIVNRNQGGIRSAGAELGRTRALLRDAAARIGADYERSRELSTTLGESQRAYEAQIVPARARRVQIAEAAHAGGRTDRLEVLEAQVRLAQARLEHGEIRLRIAQHVLDALVLLARPPTEWTEDSVPAPASG